jgi:hypothetical protein
VQFAQPGLVGLSVSGFHPTITRTHRLASSLSATSGKSGRRSFGQMFQGFSGAVTAVMETTAMNVAKRAY